MAAEEQFQPNRDREFIVDIRFKSLAYGLIMSLAVTRSEIRPLTGIRGFAAILVLLTHLYPLWSAMIPSLSWLGRMAGKGAWGVDLFFILSGFILSYVYFNGVGTRMDFAAYRKFVWHRFVRIWPVHFAALMLLVGLVLMARIHSENISGDYRLSVIPFQLTMIHAWPHTGGHNSDPLGAWAWNYPSWSISAEWFAYLLIFPALWPILKRLEGRGWLAFLLGYISLALWTLVVSPMQLKQCSAVCAVTFEFATGAFLYSVFRCSKAITMACERLATPVFILIILAFLICPGGLATYFGTIALFPILLLGMTTERSLVSKVFATRLSLWLGRISFSLYMTQAILQKIFKAVLIPHIEHAPQVVKLGLMPGTLILFLLAASIFYYFIETPSREYLRKWADSRKRPARTQTVVEPA